MLGGDENGEAKEGTAAWNCSRGHNVRPRLHLYYLLADAFLCAVADFAATAPAFAGFDEEADILPAVPFEDFSFLAMIWLLPV